MNKVLGIIGAVLFAASVAVGCFCSFPSADIVAIALAAFGLTALIVAAVKKAKDENRFSWKTIVVIVGAVAGGVLVALGGLQSNVFEAIAGAVVALITIIFGIIGVKKA
jgi:hypothetical protein